jgi:hypothetical protein
MELPGQDKDQGGFTVPLGANRIPDLDWHEPRHLADVSRSGLVEVRNHHVFTKSFHEFLYCASIDSCCAPTGTKLQRAVPLKKAIAQNGGPETVTIDKSSANLDALEAINADRAAPIKILQSKYLNTV